MRIFVVLFAGIVVPALVDASAGGSCITLRASNGHSAPGSYMYRITWDARVKSKTGSWKEMPGVAKEMNQGDSAVLSYDPDFACDAQRRYEISFSCISWIHNSTTGLEKGSGTFYFPSATGWTTDTTIDLGDLYQKHCKALVPL